MRVLHVIDTLGRGGAETFLTQLLPHLGQQGVECEVLVLRPPYTLAGVLEARGIRVHRVDLGSPWNWFRFEERFRGVLAEGRFRAVHAHLFAPIWNSALSCWLKGGPPLVSTFHSEEFSFYRSFRWRTFLRKKALGFVLRRARARLTAVSQAAARSYALHCALPAAEVLHPGVESIPERKDSEVGRLRIVTVATLKPVKGHLLLLEALHQLRAREPRLDIQLHLVGDGELRKRIENRIEDLGLGEAVRLRGELPNDEVRRLLSEFDLFVLPSLSEGLPITLLEAMMAGLPVLAAAAGGVPEVIRSGENGLLFPPGKRGALADALEWSHNHRASLKTMAQRARALAEERFHIGVAAARWAELYGSLS